MKSIDDFAYQDSQVLSLNEGSDNIIFMVDGEKLGRWSVMVDTMLSDMEPIQRSHTEQLYAIGDLLHLQAKQINILTEKLAEQYKRNAEITSKVALLSHIVEEHLCQGLSEETGLYWGDDTDDDEDE